PLRPSRTPHSWNLTTRTPTSHATPPPPPPPAPARPLSSGNESRKVPVPATIRRIPEKLRRTTEHPGRRGHKTRSRLTSPPTGHPCDEPSHLIPGGSHGRSSAAHDLRYGVAWT